MSGLRKALLLTTAERYVGLLLNFGTLAVISRILTPAEVGIAAIGWAILSIPYALRDLGTMDFLIQRPRLTPEETRAAATVGMLAAVVLVVAVEASAPAIARLYGDPRIGDFLAVMALAVLTDAVANPLVGLMRRDLAFRDVAAVNVTLAVVTAVVTITLAALGLGYMSVAWAGLAGNGAAAMMAVWLRPEPWVYRPRFRDWRLVAGFGSLYSLMAALMRAYEAMPYLALGRHGPADAMGHYSRALQTCQLPEKVVLSGIVSIAFPALAAEAREGRTLKRPYLAAIEIVTAVQWPALLLLALLAPRVVAVLFGGQWTEIVPLVQIMALSSMFGAAGMLTYPILYATGRLGQVLLMMALSLPLSALVMLVAAGFGTTALAASLFLTIPFNTYVALRFIKLHVGFSWAELGHALKRSLATSAVAVAGPLAIVAAAGGGLDQPLAVQLLMAVTALGGWFAGLAATGHPLHAEIRRGRDAAMARLAARA